MKPSAPEIQNFLIEHYRDQFARLNIDPKSVGANFDFLSQGIIDSLGMLEMIAAIEERFGITVDLDGLDAEQLTVLGPLSRYIETAAVARV